MPYHLNKLLATLFILVLFIGCRKKSNPPVEEELINTELKNGLPSNKREINGFFFACKTSYTVQPLKIYAAFGDPGRALMGGFNHRTLYSSISAPPFNGNVSLNEVSFNNYPLSEGTGGASSFYYLSPSFDISNDSLILWKTGRNTTFTPINIQIKNSFPIVFYDSLGDIIHKKRDTTFQLSNRVRNYDSLIITITDHITNTPIQKRLTSADTKVTFTVEDFGSFSTSTTQATMRVYAYKYFHKTINNKLYVFAQGKITLRVIMLESQ